MLGLLTPILGTLCVLWGTWLSSAGLVSWLRPGLVGGPEWEKAVLGATIFRICLVVMGVIVILASRPGTRTAASAKPQHPPATMAENLALGALLAATFALRLYDLNAGLWHDEITTYLVYLKSMPLAAIASTYVSENQHFLFNLAARSSVLAFGDHVWALRLPAVLFGVAGIWALYRLGREVTGRRQALLAATLMAFSYHHVWFSQNARGYTALLFWALLSSWFLIRALRHGGTARWIGYAASLALGTYTHATMLFMAVGQFFVYAIEMAAARREQRSLPWSGLWLGFGLGGFFSIFLHSFALPQLITVAGEVCTVPAWKNPVWTLFEILRGLRIGYLGAIVVPPALAVFAAGAYSYWRSNSVIVHLFLWPVLVCSAVVIAMGHHLWPRFFFYSMGFAILIAIRGAFSIAEIAGRLIRWNARTSLAAGTALAGAAVLVSALSVPFAYGPKQDYRGAWAYVEANRLAGDRVLVVGLAAYTYRHLIPTDWTQVKTAAQLAEARAGAARSWLIYTFPPEAEAVYPDVMSAAQRDFSLVKRFPGTLNNGAIYIRMAQGGTHAVQGH